MLGLAFKNLHRFIMRSLSRLAKLRRGNALSVIAFGLLAILGLCIGFWYMYGLDWERLSELCEGVDRRESYCGQRISVCNDPVGPEALPRPIVVVAAGAPRSASTFIYNALRILMRIRDPNTVAGWYEELVLFQERYGQLARDNSTWHSVGVGGASKLEAYKSLGTSLLVKLHMVQDWHTFIGLANAEPNMAAQADAVFTSHRDLRKAMRSIRNMGWGSMVDPSQFTDPDFCRKRGANYRPPHALTKREYKRTSVWVNMAKAHILCRNALLASAGDKLRMDIKTENVTDMSDDQTFNVVREMGRHIPDYDYSDNEIRSVVQELKKLRPALCHSGYGSEMAVNPITHFHRGHTTFRHSSVAESLDRMGMNAIAKDPGCRQWLIAHGYDV